MRSLFAFLGLAALFSIACGARANRWSKPPGHAQDRGPLLPL